jgi:magnesium transporter
MAPFLTSANLSDPVTQHMRREVTTLQLDRTVGEALAGLRQNPPEGRILYLYVVDAENRLRGVVPTRRLLLSPLDKPLAQIMVQRVVALPASATVLDACEFFILHRFLAFPVVDDDRRLLGIIDVELYTDELSDPGGADKGDDLFQLIGVHVAQARQTAPGAAFRNRFPWLCCNIAGGILAAFLAGFYEDELARAVSLALFIPVVLSLAESVSVQSVSLALEVLHGERPTWSALRRRLWWEALTGSLLGGAAGLIVGMVALVWLGQFRVAICLLGGIAGGTVWAATFGLALPNLLHLLQRDPRVAAGPIALVAADILTLLIYFNLARWLLA